MIPEEIAKDKEIYEASKVVYDKESAKINMSNCRVTDIPTVTRLFPPRPAGGNQEIRIQEQCNLAKEAFNEYRENKCDDKGNIKKSNLSKSESIGKFRLKIPQSGDLP